MRLLKRAKKILAVALALCLMLPMAACGEIVGSYRIVETLGEQSYAIGFRTDDYVRYYVEAALQELAADGTVSGLAGAVVHRRTTLTSPRAPALSASFTAYRSAHCLSAPTRTPIRSAIRRTGNSPAST